MRAVRISPSQVMRVRTADLNVVLQHIALPENERFDLVIGTNIFVYYEEFEQGAGRSQYCAHAETKRDLIDE